jgi:hypothetical protein
VGVPVASFVAGAGAVSVLYILIVKTPLPNEKNNSSKGTRYRKAMFLIH